MFKKDTIRTMEIYIGYNTYLIKYKEVYIKSGYC